MKASAAKGKITQLDRARLAHRASGLTTSYPKTRIRASRLYEAAFTLAFIELTRRLHQAYQHAYDKQASDRLLPQNPAPISPDELARIRGDVEKAISAKKCADFLTTLLDEAAVQSGQPYRDIMVTFDNTKFSYGNTGAYGGFATGSFETGTAGAVLHPFESNFISADRSSFIRMQTAQNALGETLHHIGTHEAYDDATMANALNAILVRQGKDNPQRFPGRTVADVQKASMYWHPKVFTACSMRY